ncbi:MAG: class I SAM-dependent methyltransferase [Actinomycetota bacterium]|nr:class I SAM-dependent methyltransferase [Actinomycetota bacterium]
MPGLTSHWTDAEAHAALGLPVASGRLKAVRKVVARLLWPILRHQVEVNRSLLAELDAVRARLDYDERQLVRAFGDLEHHSSVLVRHEEPLDRHEFLLRHLEPAIDDIVRQFELVQDKIDLGQRQAFARYHEGVGPIRAELAELSRRLDEVSGEAARAARRANEAVARATEAAEAAPSGADGSGAVQPVSEGWRRALDDVWLRMGQLDLFLAEARRAFPSPPPPEALAGLPSGFASLRLVFEEAFRGPASVVSERVRAYADELAASGGPVCDVGCGRGELLDVLAASGVESYGVEIDAEHAARARARGLDVRDEDARRHLATLEPGSLGAVTAIHVVEHLAVDELVELVELAARAIRPGGLLVLETPNPENVVVGSSSFYLDPTHTRPVPPALLAFLVAARGFSEVEVRRLERAEQPPAIPRPKPGEPWSASLAPVVDALNTYLFAPADYAVIGRRP